MSNTYFNLLKSAKIEKMNVSKTFKFSPSENQIGVSLTPPCNADIRFQVGKFSVQHPRFSITKKDLDLPTHWQNFSNDKNIKNKKLLRSLRPVNQGSCGSCFAVAIATTLSDNFLFGMDLNYNPNLSPLYILSCLKDTFYNNLCGGGNASGVIDDIIKNGIATNCCIDYYKICEENKYCTGEGKNHLDATPVTLEQRNSILDNLDCGCCTDGDHKLYKVKNKIISYSIPDIKHHLMKYGAAVGGFLVYNNFIKDKNAGKFIQTKGIYIKTVNYIGDGDAEGDATNEANLLGGHSISIIGWGSDSLTFTDIHGNKYNNVTVNYWICRNSWGPNWGDNGYFKYAMYTKLPDSDPALPDINKDCAFEVHIKVLDTDVGGIILLEPDSIEDGLLKKSLTCKAEADYKCKEGIAVGGFDSDNNNVVTTLVEHLFINRVVYVCLAIIIFICLYYIFEPKRKTRSHSNRR